MKKPRVKLLIFIAIVIYLSNPHNISNIKNKAKELINKPFIQLEQKLDNLLQI